MPVAFDFECNECRTKWHVDSTNEVARLNLSNLICLTCGSKNLSFSPNVNPPDVNTFSGSRDEDGNY